MMEIMSDKGYKVDESKFAETCSSKMGGVALPEPAGEKVTKNPKCGSGFITGSLVIWHTY